jgi:hypothetical protein
MMTCICLPVQIRLRLWMSCLKTHASAQEQSTWQYDGIYLPASANPSAFVDVVLETIGLHKKSMYLAV